MIGEALCELIINAIFPGIYKLDFLVGTQLIKAQSFIVYPRLPGPVPLHFPHNLCSDTGQVNRFEIYHVNIFVDILLIDE